MRARFAGSILFVSVVLVAGCGGEEDAAPAEEDGSAEALAALAASPCDGSSGIADSTLARLLTGANRVDAEVHDCQRLVLATGPAGEFGPLVALYPVDATLRLPRTDFATARPAVSIYSWGAAGGTYADTYADFAPAPGIACLWLRNVGDADQGWRAAIVAGAGCGAGATAPLESELALPVFERVFAGVGPADYPPTARWQWDVGAAKHFIGVKCGEAWCEVAAAGSGEPRTQELVGGNGVPRERVPGWSDAQHLVVYDSAAGRARPGPWGSIVTYPGLAADSPPWAEGLLAARITVYDPPRAFEDRFYLEPERDSGYDDLLLRFPGLEDEAWLQQGPMRRRKASRIQFQPTADHAVAGAVRWRWQERGETVWIYCPNATCAVEP